MIRVYGFTHHPYVLLSFLTLRVFALELIKQRMTIEEEHFHSFKKYSEVKFRWTVGPLTIKNKSSLPIIEKFLREMGFSMEAAVNYDPHHIISDRRKANKNNPFNHSEVVGLLEATNWMEYPRDVGNDENKRENSISFSPGNNSPQQDLSSIVAATTHVTPLASLSRKVNKRDFPKSMDVDEKDTTGTPNKLNTEKLRKLVYIAKA